VPTNGSLTIGPGVVVILSPGASITAAESRGVSAGCDERVGWADGSRVECRGHDAARRDCGRPGDFACRSDWADRGLGYS
jgi:hypothetical protein